MTNKGWAVLCHLSGFFGSFLFFLGNIVAVFILWLINKEDALVDKHGKAALNFQLSMTLYVFLLVLVITAGFIALETAAVVSDNILFHLAGFVFFGGGLIIFPVLFIAEIVFVIKASVRASNGEDYAYPLAIRFIK